MRIEAVAASFPTKVITNEDIVSLVKENSQRFGRDEGPAFLERFIVRALRTSGSNIRYWLNEGETSLGLTLDACKKAINQLEDNKKIDLLIYASVYSELVEPSSANLVAKMLGLDHVECFDMKIACDGWMKALKVAEAFITQGSYRRIMIVNAEFVMKKGFGIYPELFDITSREDLGSRFPGYTLGEVATATIVSIGGKPWKVSNLAMNNLYDICSIPAAHNPPGFSGSYRVGVNGPGCFVSYGDELKRFGFPTIVGLFQRAGVAPSEIDHLFTHSSSYRDWSEVAQQIGLECQFHDIYRTKGNVVSAAIPAAMSVALEKGTLKRGDRVFCLVASAGMSFSSAYLTF